MEMVRRTMAFVNRQGVKEKANFTEILQNIQKNVKSFRKGIDTLC